MKKKLLTLPLLFSPVLFFFLLLDVTLEEEIHIYRKATFHIPDTISPIRSITNSEQAISTQIHEGLFRVDPNLNIQPVLAQNWSLSPDKKTYTIYIKENVFFHDGEKLTASDVYQSLNRLTAEGSPVRATYQKIDTIRVIDDYTIEIKLRDPYPPFLALLSGPIAKITRANRNNSYETGTGPFTFSRVFFEKESKVLELRRFDTYHGKRPFIEKLQFWEMPEKRALKLVDQGFIHDTLLYPSRSDRLSDSTVARLIFAPNAATWIISINTSHPELMNRKVRRCLASAIDQEQFVATFVPDHAPGIGFLPPNLLGSGQITEKERYLTPPNCHSLLKDHTLILDYPEVLTDGKEMCNFFKTSLERKGASIECNGLNFGKLVNRVRDGRSHLSFMGQTLEIPEVEYFLNTFDSTSEYNIANYRSKTIDELLAKARKESDRMKRSRYYSEINKHLYQEAVTINLSHPPLTAFKHKCVSKLEVGINGDAVTNYGIVRKEPRCARSSDFR
jgi:ABC-type transport system substrate-binding protein